MENANSIGLMFPNTISEAEETLDNMKCMLKEYTDIAEKDDDDYNLISSMTTRIQNLENRILKAKNRKKYMKDVSGIINKNIDMTNGDYSEEARYLKEHGYNHETGIIEIDDKKYKYFLNGDLGTDLDFICERYGIK